MHFPLPTLQLAVSLWTLTPLSWGLASPSRKSPPFPHCSTPPPPTSAAGSVNDGGVGTREALTLLVDEDESAARDETEGGGIEAPTAEVPVMAVLELTSFSLDRAATVIRCLSCAKLRMAFSDRRMDVRRGMAPVESFGMAFSAIRPTATYLISRLVTPPKTLECSKHSQASP